MKYIWEESDIASGVTARLKIDGSLVVIATRGAEVDYRIVNVTKGLVSMPHTAGSVAAVLNTDSAVPVKFVEAR